MTKVTAQARHKQLRMVRVVSWQSESDCGFFKCKCLIAVRSVLWKLIAFETLWASDG